MVQVWYKFYQNRTKGIEVKMQNLICWQNDGISELRNFGHAENMLKTVYPLNLSFAGV